MPTSRTTIPLILLTFVLHGCAQHESQIIRSPDTVSAAVIDTAPATLPRPVPAKRINTPWEFEDITGRLIVSPNYRLHTTGKHAWMGDFTIDFAEQALWHYRTSLTMLPPPPRPLEIFLFAKRSQWQTFTRSLMKEHAGLYLSLGRGGYTTRGMSVIYDLGFADTFAMLSHEGWHQYTQATFAHALPTWMEEGIAVWMEGHRPFNEDSTKIVFDPLHNQHRIRTLLRATQQNKLIPLRELIDRSPQYFLQNDADQLLTYYAQVWGLTLFIVEGEGGKYRDSLHQLLDDAVAGRIISTIIEKAAVSPRIKRRMSFSQLGPGVILAYFNSNLQEFTSEYERFLEQLIIEVAVE